MDKIVKLALDSFRQNRKLAEEAVKTREAKLRDHTHGFFCFQWRSCRQMEQAITETKERILAYTKAEEELEVGIFDKAIELLSKIAGKIEETPMQIAMRVASSPPTLTRIQNSLTSTAHRMKEVRDYLIYLQHQKSF